MNTSTAVHTTHDISLAGRSVGLNHYPMLVEERQLYPEIGILIFKRACLIFVDLLRATLHSRKAHSGFGICETVRKLYRNRRRICTVGLLVLSLTAYGCCARMRPDVPGSTWFIGWPRCEYSCAPLHYTLRLGLRRHSGGRRKIIHAARVLVAFVGSTLGIPRRQTKTLLIFNSRVPFAFLNFPCCFFHMISLSSGRGSERSHRWTLHTVSITSAPQKQFHGTVAMGIRGLSSYVNACQRSCAEHIELGFTDDDDESRQGQVGNVTLLLHVPLYICDITSISTQTMSHSQLSPSCVHFLQEFKV